MKDLDYKAQKSISVIEKYLDIFLLSNKYKFYYNPNNFSDGGNIRLIRIEKDIKECLMSIPSYCFTKKVVLIYARRFKNMYEIEELHNVFAISYIELKGSHLLTEKNEKEDSSPYVSTR